MKYLQHIAVVLLALTCVAAASCKKDKDTTDKEYLNGTLTINLPSYVKYGQVFHINPTGVYRDDKTDTLLTYYWVHPFTGKTDTLRRDIALKDGDPETVRKDFDFVIAKDTVGTFSLSVSCVASGYYTKTATAKFSIVRDGLQGGSLSGYDFLSGLSQASDPRDGNKYYYTQAGGRDWMIENLAWEGSGIAYMENEAMSKVFGRYYSWEEAKTACPSGWRLPTDAEFVALAGGSDTGVAGTMIIDASFNGSKMWPFSANVTISNSTRFSAIPAGYAVHDGTSPVFKNQTYALFWTSDAEDDNEAYARYLIADKPDLYVGAFGKNTMLATVRCVR